MSLRGHTQQTFDKGVDLHENGPALLKSLENDVQSRLWSGINSEKIGT
jgi:hypothetical protein